MKKLFIIALWSVALSACTSGAEESTVKATIKNLEDGEIDMRVFDMVDFKTLLDTTISCTDGEFSFRHRFPNATLVNFMPKSAYSDAEESKRFSGRSTMMIELYMLKGEHYTIKGSIDENILLYSNEGSEMNSVLADLRTKYIDLQIYSDMMRSKSTTPLELSSIYRLSKKVQEKMKADKLEYVKAHLDSQLSGLFLSEQEPNNFDIYYPQISEGVRTGIFKIQIEATKKSSDLIVNSKKVKAGAQSIDFTLSGLDGETITLSSYKGKNVLLYFWGTW